ncbi:MAG: CBS domain-containing protein [Ardenticatenia bacterium]|nr:CBS domain-containing protein [Ardenticatenia bacterium]
MAAWLLERGANLDLVREFLEHPLSDAQRQLYRRLMEQAEFVDVGGSQVVIAAAQADEYVEEISTLAHLLRDLYDPDALFLVVGMGHHVQVVARSTTDAIHVGRLMERLGGGGHARAAAAFADNQEPAHVVNTIKELVRQHVRPAVTVRDIMSRGRIRTIPPDMPLKEAAREMHRWGHEGFPVVNADGKVVGVLTRRDVDRALHHHLGKEPVAAVMHTGPIWVTPDDGVERVQRVMVEYNVGQVPVVAEGNIVGIVTRTDLINLWAATSTRNVERETIVRRLEDAVPAPLLALVRAIAREANRMGYSLYFVGGFVRDLLLGYPLKDLDLVVEGDAIALARRLATRYGGRVVGHRRFGTAKWILGEGEGPRDPLITAEGVPPHIDLVTARTEFYEQPSALPTVEQSNIKLDLHRRDFTINTLAIALDEDRYGQLLDFYGGLRDLQEGIIRVLHNLSFVEDPTRILRAVRFEQRLGFRLEERTGELLRDSLELLNRVSGERLRHELELIVAEPRAVQMLRRLDTLGALHHIDPALTFDEGAAERLRRVHEAGERDFVAVLAAWLWPLPWPDVARIADRLAVRGRQRKPLWAVLALRDRLDIVGDPQRPPGDVVEAIEACTSDEAPVRWAALLADHPLAQERLTRYLETWRHIRPAVRGDLLRELGVPPGPVYKHILKAVRRALLNGEVQTGEEQRALAERLARQALSEG